MVLFSLNCYGQITLQDLLDYREECYADSYLVKESYSNVSIQPVMVIDSVKGLNYKFYDYSQPMFSDAVYRVREKWYHREPTFTGFIIFLEGKK